MSATLYDARWRGYNIMQICTALVYAEIPFTLRVVSVLNSDMIGHSIGEHEIFMIYVKELMERISAFIVQP